MKLFSHFIFSFFLINLFDIKLFALNLRKAVIRKETNINNQKWKKTVNDCKNDASFIFENENASPVVISSLGHLLAKKASKRRLLDFRYQLKVNILRKEIKVLVRKNCAIQAYVQHRLSSLTQRAIFDEFYQKIVECFHDPTNPISSAAHLLGTVELMSLNDPNPTMKNIYDILRYNEAFRMEVWKEFKFEESLRFPYFGEGMDLLLSGYLSDSPDPLFTTVYLSSENDEEVVMFFNTWSKFLNRPSVKVFDQELVLEGLKAVVKYEI